MIGDAVISPRAIRAQVETIVASESFVRSHRIQRFLTFIVEETLAGRAEELGEYGIGIAVFDRQSDFEPALDPIVRNDARRLRLKLLEYYRQAPQGQVIIDIPKGGYVPVFKRAGNERRMPTPVSTQRLAVFPFEVLSATPEGPMQGRDLCMRLTANLTKVDGLEIVAHCYLMEQSLREAASELSLSHAIHGCYSQWNDRCRVIVNLIQVPSGIQVWAQEYEFDVSEVFEVQSEIVANVLREVRPRHTTLALAA